MIASPRIVPLLVLFGALVFAASLPAQIRVDLQMSKREFVEHEPVEATVTITNHAGRDLLIHGEGLRSWLDFSIRRSGDAALSPIRRVQFQSVRVPAGQAVAKTITLNQVYRVTELGNYGCTATVRLPNGAGTFNSNRVSFSVTKGTPIYRQRVGDPGLGNVREFTLSLFNRSDRSSIYVHVVDVRTGRTIQAFKLGNAMSFQRPQATMDGSNVLHVLYLQSPGVYGHARVSPDGKYLGTDYFTRGASGRPALETFANGQVAVAAAVPYNPDAEKERRAQIRRLSERPAITYR